MARKSPEKPVYNLPRRPYTPEKITTICETIMRFAKQLDDELDDDLLPLEKQLAKNLHQAAAELHGAMP